MDNRRWPYDPYDPYARRPPPDDDGWVVAGEEPNGVSPGGGAAARGAGGSGAGGWAPPPRNGRNGPSPRYDDYPTQAQPRQSYPPQPAAGYRYPPPAAPRPYQATAHARPQPARLPAVAPDDEPRPSLASTLSWATGVFVVPMLLYLAWAFTRSSVAPPGCVDASGAPCPSPRVEAAENLLGVLPAITGAFVLSLLIAVGLRRIATGWRSASVGLAAAVIGAGVATVVAAALG